MYIYFFYFFLVCRKLIKHIFKIRKLFYVLKYILRDETLGTIHPWVKRKRQMNWVEQGTHNAYAILFPHLTENATNQDHIEYGIIVCWDKKVTLNMGHGSIRSLT